MPLFCFLPKFPPKIIQFSNIKALGCVRARGFNFLKGKHVSTFDFSLQAELFAA
jgi:hypothetical protein